ncbi:hypothetical protein [Sphingomonas montanisoli]|uniref:DUF4398 domain-containing protein n=1 Tax=Sphingomonas montanisoli TaxID=2606412 RepID=A0A5D9C6X0_9SPHN|nr:hypothetical protein [Sphingomonas montanisoli]TZG25755.1 hypothetical protein FYJ91_12195 [Sphingomonas montanisoli]
MTQSLRDRCGLFLPVICLLALAACDGAHEKAGREADQAAAAAMGQNQTGEGPRERLGEAQDRVDRANARANDAAADALKRQGDKLREQADLDADRLAEQAKALRASKQ